MNKANTKIDIKDISVVVQGAIHPKYTQKCLRSIRKYLPGATIILSTWEGSNVEGLDYDKLLLNKDPGTSGYRNPFEPNINLRLPDNLNRQILSTKNGLKEVETKYAMKLRTDFRLTGNGFLNYFDKFNKHIDNAPELLLFKKRILIMGYSNVTPFWVFDLFSFGLTEDMLRLWDVDLVDDDIINYYYNQGFVNLTNNIFSIIGMTHRYFAEPYIFVKCIAKTMPEIYEIFKDYTDATEENRILSLKLIINNFVALETKLLNVEPLKETLFVVKKFRFFSTWGGNIQHIVIRNINFLSNIVSQLTAKKLRI